MKGRYVMATKKGKKKKRRPLEFDYLPVDKIDVSLWNVRKSNVKEDIKELEDSIREIGVQQPIVVYEKEDDRYELIIGQRRYLACRNLGKPRIPALITKVRSKTDAVIQSFSENIHRLELSYRDKMRVATELLSKFGSISKVAEHIGVGDQTVISYLGYAAVPEKIKRMVDEGKFGATTALEIARNIPDEKRAIEIAEKVQELPRTEDRDYLVDVARENPSKSVETIFKIAKKRSLMKTITIHVTQNIYKALTEAAERYGRAKEGVAREAIEEWLTRRGLY